MKYPLSMLINKSQKFLLLQRLITTGHGETKLFFKGTGRIEFLVQVQTLKKPVTICLRDVIFCHKKS